MNRISRGRNERSRLKKHGTNNEERKQMDDEFRREPVSKLKRICFD